MKRGMHPEALPSGLREPVQAVLCKEIDEPCCYFRQVLNLLLIVSPGFDPKCRLYVLKKIPDIASGCITHHLWLLPTSGQYAEVFL